MSPERIPTSFTLLRYRPRTGERWLVTPRNDFEPAHVRAQLRRDDD